VEEVVLHYAVGVDQTMYVIKWVCMVRTRCVQLKAEYNIVIFDNLTMRNGKDYILMIFIANLF